MLFFASGNSVPAHGPDIPHLDKLVHFLAFGLLAQLVFRCRPREIKWALWSIFLVSLYGITDEFHQSFTPGRTVDAWDWVADTVGATTSTALMLYFPGYDHFFEKYVFRNPRHKNNQKPSEQDG